MTDLDKKQFALLMGGLFAAFRCESNKETMAIYFQYLSDFSIEAVRYAVDHIIRKGEKFPAVSKIRECANIYRPPDNREPMVPAMQIEEYIGDPISADDFFKHVGTVFGGVE